MKKSRVKIAFVLFGIVVGQLACNNRSVPMQSSQKVTIPPVDLVEPLVDAANSRWFFFNSATRPFGMVNLSPDMVINGAWNSGYRYNQDTIRCFSHVHAWQLSGIPVFPTTGSFKGHLGADKYGSSYSHDKEKVEAGYHQIYLNDYQINAELTATTRVGFHRYTFPAAEQSQVHIDFSTFLGPCDTDFGYAKKVSDTEIEGYAIMGATRRRPKPTHIYFVLQMDQPFDDFGGWQNGKMVNENEIEGAKTGAVMSFSTEEGEQRLMKVAISYVSSKQARLNLTTELPHWNFDQVRTEAKQEWNDWLSKIEIEGGTLKQQKRFYTDLWHALQGRRIISDVNGKYCDMTGPERRIGQIPLDKNGQPTFNHYNSDSFWGAQWTLNTLWHLVYPKVTEEFINSMLLMYQDGGYIPRGPSGGNYTYVMTGASSTPFIVSAYMKGIRGFDVEMAYEGMKKNHSEKGLMAKAGYEHATFSGGGMDFYTTRGYIPNPLGRPKKGYHENGGGQTLEYAYQDWTLGQLAKVLGREEDFQYYNNRATNYKNLWNDELGWMWVKELDGQWRAEVDLLKYGNGWVEGNAAQFTWWVPHDVAGLIELMGGSTSFISKLNNSFTLGKKHDFTSAKSHDKGEQEKFRRVYINYGNQPCMQMAYLFNYAGAPWLTQQWSREVVDAVYSDLSPQLGYSGDEDQGLMGALAVIMKIGIFSVRGGAAVNPVYEIASPIFEKITIHLDSRYYTGTTFAIEAKNASSKNKYIQHATLDGQILQQPWFSHQQLVDGGSLVLEMGDTPNKDWGSGMEAAPPSMSVIKE